MGDCWKCQTSAASPAEPGDLPCWVRIALKRGFNRLDRASQSARRDVAVQSTNKRKRMFANMDTIETPDPNTVKITLKQPSALLPFLLAETTGAGLSPKTADGDGVRPVGTGPRRFVAWTRGDSRIRCYETSA
jgi:ABC-type transport system substrate-binding protein